MTIANRGADILVLQQRLDESEQQLAASQLDLTLSKIHLADAKSQIKKLLHISHDVQQAVSVLQQELASSTKEMAEVMATMVDLARCVFGLWCLLVVSRHRSYCVAI